MCSFSMSFSFVGSPVRVNHVSLDHEREDLKEIFEDRWTVSDKITTIRSLMKTRETVRFGELFEGSASRTEVVVTFLALLELIRMNQLQARQGEAFDEIEIQRVDDANVTTAEPVPLAE